ncbi:hypothetical protein KSS87_000776 [Heliosperma pusillum]|nr:hypothetical protein KSS87_000776 [Heliosperma pusillum]
MAEKVAEVMNRVVNSNTFVNICLLGCFSVLGLRSSSQQNIIESLEADNSRLTSTNKSLQKTIWDWKQQLYAEASSDSSVVSLSRIKSIYGDVVATPPPGVTDMKGQRIARIIFCMFYVSILREHNVIAFFKFKPFYSPLVALMVADVALETGEIAAKIVV